MLKLGSFELIEPLGKGGMSEVWRGAHASGTAVAIKIISAVDHTPDLANALFTEVRAVAALHHPGVVMLLDQGTVTAEVESASNGRFTEGRPYLVMELASSGTLARIKRTLAYPELRATLLVLLDALAHAHARGVIHRDLKPSNLLIAGKKDLRPGLKIADFGLAFAAESARRDPHARQERRAGTLAYMAPEQLAGAWRDYGPWTDLFSLGCIAYQLATAKRPWPAPSEDLQSRAKALESPPELLLPEHEAPEGFAGWIGRLLERDPNKRFRCAADAAFQLVKLGGVSEDDTLHATTEMVRVAELSDEPTEDRDPLIDASTKLEGQLVTFSLAEPEYSERSISPVSSPFAVAAVSASSSPQFLAPPIPPSWRAVRTDPAPLQLVGAGLALYPLRSIPFVDRSRERDAIWSALREVKQTNQARAVVIRGSAGSGKSRLAEWTAERASELGAAIVLKALHSPIAGPSDGIGAMLARHLRCIDLERPQVLRRVEAIIRGQGATHAYEWEALTEVMAITDAGGPASSARSSDRARSAASFMATSHPTEETAERIRFAHPAERYEVLRRFLARSSEERPVIVWIEDAQWASDALSFALHVLKSPEPTRALLLITQRDEALAERLVEAALIEKLQRAKTTEAIDIGPLDANDQLALVEQMLPFEGNLAHEIAARTAGNPLFAAQLVGDWVQRGILETASHGFRIRAGERAVLPDDVHQVWADRIARLVSDGDDATRIALELAAALGQSVDLEEWRQTCVIAGLTVPQDRWTGLTNELLASCLAKPIDRGFAFVHAMVRESLERAASEAKRLPLHHRAAAAMLLARDGRVTDTNAERLANHWIAAEEPERAVDPLLLAARRRFDSSELAEARVLLERRETLLETASRDRLASTGGPALPDRDPMTHAPEDPRWGEGWILRAELLHQLGDLEECERWSLRAEEAASRHSWTQLMPGAFFVRAQALQSRSELKAAALLYELAIPLCRSNGDARGEAACLRELAFVEQQRGELGRAEAQLKRARDLFQKSGDLLGVAATMQRLGLVARQRGDLNRSANMFNIAQKAFERAGNAYGVATTLNGLGDTARYENKLELAERRYREAVATYEAIGAYASAITPRVNLVCTALAHGRTFEARVLAEEMFAPLEQYKRRALLGCMYLYTLPALAEEAAWSTFDDRLALAHTILEETGFIDPDVAWPARVAADLAHHRGQHARAKKLYQLAGEHWRALGKSTEAREVEELIARLS